MYLKILVECPQRKVLFEIFQGSTLVHKLVYCTWKYLFQSLSWRTLLNSPVHIVGKLVINQVSWIWIPHATYGRSQYPIYRPFWHTGDRYINLSFSSYAFCLVLFIYRFISMWKVSIDIVNFLNFEVSLCFTCIKKFLWIVFLHRVVYNINSQYH